MTTMRLRKGRVLSERGGHGINRHLRSMTNAPDVCWTSCSNSYVAIHDERGFALVSINGIGEIRWLLRPNEWWMGHDAVEARDYFFEEVR